MNTTSQIGEPPNTTAWRRVLRSTDSGSTTIIFPDGRRIRTKGFDATLRHRDVIEVRGAGQFSVYWLAIQFGAPRGDDETVMVLELLEPVKSNSIPTATFTANQNADF
jgi:hypothetical protein